MTKKEEVKIPKGIRRTIIDYSINNSYCNPE